MMKVVEQTQRISKAANFDEFFDSLSHTLINNLNDNLPFSNHVL
jgi:hypothetical protein